MRRLQVENVWLNKQCVALLLCSQMEFALLNPQLSERGSKKAEENSSGGTLRTHIPTVAHTRWEASDMFNLLFAFSLLRH